MRKLNALVTAACFAPVLLTAVPTSAGGFVLPSGYTMRYAKNYGVVCDGSRDTTAAIRSALSKVPAYSALKFPAGTCVMTGSVQLIGKNNVIIVGDSPDTTIFRAKDPVRGEFVVGGSSNVTVRDLQVYSPNTTGRYDGTGGRGIYVDNSSGVTVSNVKVRNVSGAGMLFNRVTNGKILNSRVENSRADAFHATGGSQGITMQYNVATNAGDDCFASIGYGAGLNRNVKMLDNTCSDNKASGVSFEGTIGGSAYRNRLTRTGVAGIRIDSQNAYMTGTVTDIDVRDNVLTGVRTRTAVDHAAIMIFTDRQPIKRLTFVNNTIQDPKTWLGVRMFGHNGQFVTDVSFQNNVFKKTTTGPLSRCFSIEVNTSNITRGGNTLNGASCG